MAATEVEARAIDADLATITEFDAWLAGMQVEVDALIDSGPEPREIATPEGYASSVAQLKEVRGLIRRIDSGRTERMRPVKGVITSLEARVREAKEPLTRREKALKAAQAAWDKALADRRRGLLEREYAEFAPALADMCPYARIAEAFDPEGRWLDKRVTDDDACEYMRRAVAEISDGWQSIAMTGYDADELEQLRADFLLTLDVGRALKAYNQRRATRDAVRAFVAEGEPEPAPQQEPAPAPKPAQQPAPASEWRLAVAGATEAQVAQIAEYARSLGLGCAYWREG